MPSQTLVNSTNLVPVMNQELFDNMVLATGISPEPQTGTIIARVVNGQCEPAQGVSAASLPAGLVGPFFDGTGATPWSSTGTGARGVVMFPNVSVTGATTIALTSGQQTETTVNGVQVVDGGITYLDATMQ